MSSNATVTAIVDLAPSVVQLNVAFDDAFVFAPGQWVHFRFPDVGVSRAYTIASAPEQPQSVELCVRVGAGRGGAALKSLGVGTIVAIDGPYGDFVLPDDDLRDVVFLAGDTGIAPIRSIVLHMLAVRDPRKVTVLYEPDHRHILYAADFDPLARSGTIRHESGGIETLIDRNRRPLSESTIMACGFDPFLDRARAALDDQGIDISRVISETFGPQP